VDYPLDIPPLLAVSQGCCCFCSGIELGPVSGLAPGTGQGTPAVPPPRPSPPRLPIPRPRYKIGYMANVHG